MARISSTASRGPIVALLVFGLAACGDDAAGLGDASSMAPDTGVAIDTGVSDTGTSDPDAGTDAGAMEDMGPVDMGATTSPFTTLRNQGLSEQRIDLVFIGDGYTEDELEDDYTQHVEHVADRIFSRRLNGATEPFYQFRSLFNIHRVNLASNESGIDDPANNMMVDTALDGTTGCGAIGGCSPSVDTAKVKAAVDEALMGTDLDADLIIVTLNTSEPLEASIVDANGKFALYGGGPTNNDDVDTSERGLRQIARAMAGLALAEADGGGTYAGPEPTEPNLTTSSTGAKWSTWLGFNAPNDGQGEVNAFEGGGGFSTGVYRPVSGSKLTGDYPGPFDPIAREAIILAMFDIVPPVVQQTPNSGSLMNPPFIDAIESVPLVQVRWFVDGMDTMVDGGRIGFVAWAMANGLAAGPHAVEARVSVQTQFRYPDCRGCQSSTQDFVRRPSAAMSQSIMWNVIYRP